MQEEEYVSCKSLLRLNAMAGSLLLSGQDRLGEKVTRANVIEMADVANWAQPGEVVLSSGYAFRDNEASLIAAVEALHEKGAAAFCIKPRRFFHSLPENVVNRAREINFILIELPMEAIFANIVHEFTEELLQKETLSIRRVQDQTELLLDVLLKDDSMEDRLGAIEELIQNPFLIFDSDNELLISRNTRSILQKDIPDDFLRQLYHGAAPEGVPTLRIDGGSRNVVSYQVEISGDEFIRIILVEYNGPFRETDLLAVKRISRILALEMKNAMTYKKSLRRYKDKFVQDWLFNNFDSELDLVIAAQTYGYRLNAGKLYRVCVLNTNNSKNDAAFLERDVSVIHHIIQNLSSNIVFTIHNGKLILVFESGPEDEATGFPGLSYLTDRLTYVLAKGDMSFCISRPAGAQEVPQAYLQAKKISELSGRCGITAPFILDVQLGILSLLAMLPEEDAIQYRDKFLEPVKKHDAACNSCLLETLRMYLDTRCNAKAAAEKMYIHYNTIAYRLEKIKTLLGVDIDDAETRLELQIAFKLMLIYH